MHIVYTILFLIIMIIITYAKKEYKYVWNNPQHSFWLLNIWNMLVIYKRIVNLSDKKHVDT